MSNKRQIHSLDIKSAFLQWAKINIAVLPPPETNTVKLWRLNITVYGLCDAPIAWYQKLKTELSNVATSQSIYEMLFSFGTGITNLKDFYVAMWMIVSLLVVFVSWHYNIPHLQYILFK